MDNDAVLHFLYQINTVQIVTSCLLALAIGVLLWLCFTQTR